MMGAMTNTLWVGSLVAPFLFCLTLSSCVIWWKRYTLTSDKLLSVCLCVFFVEMLTSLLLPSLHFVTSLQLLLAILSAIVIVMLASEMPVADVLFSITALALCRLSSMLTSLPGIMQIIICYGAILGGDLFITYLESVSHTDSSPHKRRSTRSRRKSPNSNRSKDKDNVSPASASGNCSSRRARRRSRLPSWAEFLNANRGSLDFRRRLSSLSSIWSIPASRFQSGSLSRVSNSNRSPSGRLPVSVRRPSARDCRRISLPSFCTPRSSFAEYQGAIAIGDWSGLLSEADGLLADLLVDASPTSVHCVVRAVRRLLQASVQAQMAQQYANSLHQQRRKSTIGGFFQRSFEDDLNESAKMNQSPFLGHPESCSDPNARLRSGAAISARRLSATLWTTTTSATGMPTLVGEAEPLTKKNRPLDLQTRRGSLCRGGTYLSTPTPNVAPAPLNPSSVELTGGDTPEENCCNCDSTNTNTLFDNSSGAASKQLHTNNTTTAALSSPVHPQPQPQPQPHPLPQPHPVHSEKSGHKSVSTPDGANDYSNYVYSSVNNNSASNQNNAPSDTANNSWKPEEDVFQLLKNVGVSKSIMEGPLIASMNIWNFPIFDLEKIIPERILTATAFKVFDDCSLFDYFNIDLKKFVKFFAHLEDGYWSKNTYHTRTHAADVMQGVYYLTMNQVPCSGSRHDHLSGPGMDFEDVTTDSDYLRMHGGQVECSLGAIAERMPEMEHMSLLLAAAMHDYDHPGRTNAFLVDTSDPLAILYNDRSVLENHHAASSWKLLMKKEHDFITAALDPVEFKRLRFLVLETILATDLKKHFDFLAQMKAKLTDASQTGGPVFDWTNEADRIFYSQLAIKLADIGGPTKAFDIHRNWTVHICEEFYQQGDDEASRGLPVSTYMSRNNPQVAQLQESFITHMVGPLCELFEAASLIPVNSPADEMGDKFLDKRNSGDAQVLPKIKVTRAKEGSQTNGDNDTVQDGGTSVSTNLCRHSAVSLNVTESIIMRQIKSNLAYWQQVLSKEPTSSSHMPGGTSSNITRVEEQANEEEYPSNDDTSWSSNGKGSDEEQSKKDEDNDQSKDADPKSNIPKNQDGKTSAAKKSISNSTQRREPTSKDHSKSSKNNSTGTDGSFLDAADSSGSLSYKSASESAIQENLDKNSSFGATVSERSQSTVNFSSSTFSSSDH